MNIYLRKDQRFEGRITDKETGKRISFYGKTAKEVEEKIAAAKKKTKKKPECCLTVENIFTQWIEALSKKAKASTVSVYRGRAEKHILPRFGKCKVSELTSQQIQSFVSDKFDAGLSASYIADIIVVLKGILKFADRHCGVKSVISDVILPRRKKAEVRLLNKHQQGKLHKYLKNNPNLNSLGIMLSVFMGLRVGEVCGLKWGDIDFESKLLKVSKTVQRIKKTNGKRKTQIVITEPKSESSIRTIPIPDCVLTILKKFRTDDNLYILSGREKPMEPRRIQYRFAQILKKEKLPSIHFHALRHMFATNCVELGFDVKSLSEILGHSSVEITLNRYVHSSMESKRKYMRKICFAA